MKLAFVFAVLASMAVLSLAAPPLDGDEAMLQALEATLGAETHGSASADATKGPVTDVETSMTSVRSADTTKGPVSDKQAPAIKGPVSDKQALVTNVETSMTSARLVRYILITSPRNNWMSISWVACYDRLGKNMCAGKTATSNNAYGMPWGNTANPLTFEENAKTSEGNSFISGSPAAGNWWRVDLGAPGSDIVQIKYRPRNDSPDQGQGLVITMLDKDGIKLEGASNTFTTSGTGTQTYKVDGSPLGYSGAYDDHVYPVVTLLQSLRDKLVNAMKTSNTDFQSKKDAMAAAKIKSDEIQRQAVADAAQAAGEFSEAKSIDGDFAAKSTKEIAMLDNIMAMLHTLNGKK